VMLNEGRQYLEFATHLALFPGLAIMIAVLGFNLLGDGLRDALGHMPGFVRPGIAESLYVKRLRTVKRA
jgi:uncharacterized BrkB/YihY/UPF0761 family membrane protein